MSLDKEIEALESTLIRLKQLKEHQVGAVKEVDKWEPKGGGFMVWCSGDIEELDSINSSRCFGTERQTREQAQRAAVEMRRFNRLLALRDELCGDDVVDWDDGRYKHYVYFNHYSKGWVVDFDDDHEVIMPYFTTEKLAQKACDMLNSGEVEL